MQLFIARKEVGINVLRFMNLNNLLRFPISDGVVVVAIFDVSDFNFVHR